MKRFSNFMTLALLALAASQAVAQTPSTPAEVDRNVGQMQEQMRLMQSQMERLHAHAPDDDGPDDAASARDDAGTGRAAAEQEIVGAGRDGHDSLEREYDPAGGVVTG